MVGFPGVLGAQLCFL